MTEGVIYDRGYRPHEESAGRTGPRAAIVREGIRRILGLRRKARKKIFPWALLTIALLASAVLVALHFAAGSIAAALAEGLPTYPELFDFYSRIALLFVAFTAPGLIVPDRADGVLSVYFSRPLTVGDYLGAKLVAYLLVAGSIYLVPQIALYVGLAALSDDGWLRYMADNVSVLWQVIAVALAFLVVHGGVLGAISSHVRRTGTAAAIFLGLVVAGGGLAGALATSEIPGGRFLSLLALDDHARVVRDWLFGVDIGRYAPEAAGFSPWVSVAAIVAVGVGGALWTYRVYREQA